jgi:hypothetical protein
MQTSAQAKNTAPRSSGLPPPDRYSDVTLTVLESLADNAGQAVDEQGDKSMAFGTSDVRSDAARCSNGCAFFGLSFFSFSTAAKAEGTGV